MKPVAAVVLCASLGAILSACAAAPRVASQPTVRNTTSIECVASNYKRSGCKTTHEIVVGTRLARPDGGVPVIEDLRVTDEAGRF